MAQHNRGWRERDQNSQSQDWNRGPYAGVGPLGYQRSDKRIYEDACERLTWHGQIDARNIHVEVNNGEVTLSGSVKSRETRRMAERILEKIRGVKDIHNQLHIEEQERQRESGRPGGGSGRIDRVGQSGVYPASGPLPGTDAEVHGMASWGQGERGAAGSSEFHPPEKDPESRGRRRK